MTVQEFFDTLPERVDPAKTAGMNNTYVFEVEDADCTISASEETFAKIVAGESNATSAYMTGKLKIAGDIGAALKLQKLF